MTTDGNYSFAGIAHAEPNTRHNEYRTGVPTAGAGQALLAAPAPSSRQQLARLEAMNNGEERALVRLVHQGATKSVAAELLAALAAGGNRYVGNLQYGAVTPGTVVITNAGAPVDIVDDGNGVLHDVGIPANTRGTIDYVNGIVDFTYGAAPTEPVSIAYDHQDYSDFQSAAQSLTATAGGAYPETFQTTIGRVVPGSVTLTDGVLTFVDDGKGNMIETTGGGAVARGTVDYGTGVITLTSGSAPLNAGAGAITIGFRYNPFASLLAPGGACALMDLFNGQLPELTQEPWADGLKGESSVGLWGETVSEKATNLTTRWYHSGDDPFFVEALFSGFPPGGQTNDPRVLS